MCIGDRILPPKLFAGNSAFALATIKERMPVILVRTLDDLNKNITKYGNPENNFEDAKLVIHRLSKLRYELVTNKPFATLFPEPACSDIDQWNSEIARLEEGQNTAFSAPWLFTECYMYRRIMNIVSQSLPSFDPFTERKLEGFKNSRRLIASMIACLDQTLANTEEGQPADRLKFYLACSLWSNEFDLSLSAGNTQVENSEGGVNHLRQDVLLRLQNNMAVDELDDIVRSWLSWEPATVALVMDNTGPEMVADLILAEYLLCSHLAERVVFYPKALPWFVSDVTPKDLDWFLVEGLPSIANAGEVEPKVFESISGWAEKWRRRFENGSFSTISHPFWTLPLGYNHLRSTAPELFRSLTQEASVTIFKGDLHYRKLLEDRSWAASSEDPKFVFGRCFPSAFDCCRGSSPLILVLRVAKSDVAVGVSEHRHSKLVKEDPDWWTKGKYGFAQIVSLA
uniref:Sugar phosphate phosphatase n=4 Tax=Schistocephalus solidus TaxID=70667 RepID=A0A0X3PW97_SCHSO